MKIYNEVEKNLEEENLVIAPKKKRAKASKDKKVKVEKPKEEVIVEPVKEEPEVKEKKENPAIDEAMLGGAVADLDSEMLKLLPLIEEWKGKYKRIYMNNTEEGIVLWKKLNRTEYKEVLKQVSESDASMFEKQEEVVRRCVLYPENIMELIDENGGLASVLSDEIFKRSGFALSVTTEF